MGEKWLCRSDSPQVEGWGRVCVHGLTTALELGYQLCSIGESFTMKETVSGGFGRNQKTATTLSAPHIPPLYLLAFLSIGSTLLASGSSCLFEYSWVEKKKIRLFTFNFMTILSSHSNYFYFTCFDFPITLVKH